MADPDPIAVTRQWIRDFVIGLNLCPFARKVFDADRIRFVSTDVTGDADLLDVLSDELKFLAAAPQDQIETTILIHPRTLLDFRDYNDFLATADRRVDEMGLRGAIQIASFHPQYQFAGSQPDEVANYTNRSPHPMLHLLREESITEVASDPDVLLGIPKRNVELLREMGLRKVRQTISSNPHATGLQPRSG
jgi:uncharacterized protein